MRRLMCLITILSALTICPLTSFGQSRSGAPPRSRWSLILPVGITTWKFVGGTSIWLWQQPVVNEQLAVGYRLTAGAPYELRVSLLAGQRLDQFGQSLGGMVSFLVLPRPFAFGVGTIFLHRFGATTDFGLAGIFGIGTPLGQSGFALGFGGQLTFYPFAPGQPLALVLGPSISYRFP